MTELRVSAFISIYSQNVSCDKHSENLQGIDGMENFEFRNRIELVIFTLKMLKPLPDIVAMNEVSPCSFCLLHSSQSFPSEIRLYWCLPEHFEDLLASS